MEDPGSESISFDVANSPPILPTFKQDTNELRERFARQAHNEWRDQIALAMSHSLRPATMKTVIALKNEPVSAARL